MLRITHPVLSKGLPVFRVFLDVDGVLADFVGRACECHGVENIYLDPKNKGYECMHRRMGITSSEFWEPLKGNKFWRDLDVLEEGVKTLAFLEDTFGRDNIFLLSKPADDIGYFIGRYEWIHKNFPKYLQRTFLHKQKHMFAGSSSLLIDDSIDNCELFQENDGTAFLYQQPWNDKGNFHPNGLLLYSKEAILKFIEQERKYYEK